jgi:hypothetical protein
MAVFLAHHYCVWVPVVAARLVVHTQHFKQVAQDCTVRDVQLFYRGME